MTPIAGPWAKLAYDDAGTVSAALPLADHSFDVAAAMEALLAGGAWAGALATTAGRALTAQDHARIVVLAALHDIGKTNAGFQARWNPRAPKIGHEGQVAPLMLDPTFLANAVGQAWREMREKWGTGPYQSALMAHHGRPREEFGVDQGGLKPWFHHRSYWKPQNGYDPLAEAGRLIDAVRARWPEAWQPGERLPDNPPFVALFAGLVTLADWLGSDTKRFPVEGPHGSERDAMRDTEAKQAVAMRGLTPLTTPGTDFASTFDFPPRGVQNEADADDLGPVALIEAETGSGKTEAALWRWLQLRRAGEVDGLYFALPTRSAAVQLHKRVGKMLDRVWGKGALEAVLAVPGYLRVGDADGQALPGWEVRWDDRTDDSRWAAEHGNRYLAARVAVGTIDQALLGALKVKHAPVRAAALARSLLVVDEVHASDAYMGALLERLLKNHVAAGGRALLLSATLGAEARSNLLGHAPLSLAEAESQPYPALSGRAASPRLAPSSGARAKTVHVDVAGLIDDAHAIAASAIDAASRGASVLVVRNSVGGAIAVAQAVEGMAPDLAFRVNDVATLHHGRFAASDRRLLDDAVERAFGKGRSAQGRVLVGTQTLEQSLDIDADLLITDLAPMDVLLQRIGRLHRHEREDRGGFAQARAVVLQPADRDLALLLGRVRERHGLGPMTNGGGVYPDLLQLEATLRLLEEHATITIPADNRRLVERALHPEIRDALTAELGTAWMNHDAAIMGIAYAERGTAMAQSVDFSQSFRELVFPIGETIGTRLGDKDLLVDFEQPLDGPFGHSVRRIAIPHWMARGIGPEDEPELLGAGETGQRFRLGSREFSYGRWGLTQA